MQRVISSNTTAEYALTLCVTGCVAPRIHLLVCGKGEATIAQYAYVDSVCNWLCSPTYSPESDSVWKGEAKT